MGIVALVLICASARGHSDAVGYTSFATIEIRPPLITGTLWLELEPVAALFRLDRNGDGHYAEAELWAARRPLKSYLDERLPMMWQGRVHQYEVHRVELASRRGMGHDFVSIAFTVRDLPPGAPLAIVSRLLGEHSPKARCVALIRHAGRAEVFVLGPWDYYRSQRSALPKVEGSTYRPRSQRGRIAVTGDLRLEMLYAIPEGALYLYSLKEDRETPRGIEAKPITVHIRPAKKEDPPTRVVLAARPLPVDESGLCSRFVGPAPQFKDVGAEAFSVDLVLGSGADQRRVVFDFPVVAIMPKGQVAKASRRYACPKLCLGIESKDPSAKCMRCGSGLVEAYGARVPGVGRIGRHGGVLQGLDPRPLRVEALLPSSSELRLYFTDPALKPQPVGELSGKVLLWRDQRVDEGQVELELTPAEDDSFLFAKIPAEFQIPLTAQCDLHFSEERRTESLTFHLHQIIDPGE
jgi:hypothetical protein